MDYRSVIRAVASGASLNLGSKVQAQLTDFRELTAREITGFDCSVNEIVRSSVCIHELYVGVIQ